MWKRLALLLVAATPILPLACGSSDATDDSDDGGGRGGNAGRGNGGKGGANVGGRGIDDSGGEAGEEALGGMAGDDGLGGAASGSGGSGAVGVGGHGGSGATSGGAVGGTGTGGTGGTSGTGTGGAGGTSGYAGKAGASGSSGSGGMSGAGGSSCGDAGQACCTTGNACTGISTCLNSTACSCVANLFGRYLLRTDGYLLYESDPSSTAQTAVLDAATGLPLGGVTAASEGAFHGCAVVGAAKTAWCWRSTSSNGNSAGQLGNGTMDSSGPVFRATQVLTAANQPLTNVVGIAYSAAFNGYHPNTCAVTSDGKLYCWGDLSYLVNGGSPVNSAYAVQITTDGVNPFSNVLQVSVNDVVACALVQGSTAKEVWCWGSNGYGQLATGDTLLRRYPTKVLGLTSPTKVTTGGYGFYGTTCAIDGGNVRCWGDNEAGSVGDGTNNTPILAPKIVTLMGGITPVSDVVDINGTGTYKNTCALNGSHLALCWGSRFQSYPATYPASNIAVLGAVDNDGVRYVTGDGQYHIAPINGTAVTRTPNCGLLQ